MSPTEEEVSAAVDDISDKLDRLGFVIDEIEGPLDRETEENDEIRYYIFVQKNHTKFFILLSSEHEFGQVIYPFTVAGAIGDQLTDEETKKIVGNDSFENESSSTINEKVGIVIIENTPIEQIWRAKFNLSAYASTALVNYNQKTADNGFPIEFQCTRGIFPYTEGFTLRELDDRVESTLIAGNRGSRYVNSSLIVDKKDKENPDEYVLTAQL